MIETRRLTLFRMGIFWAAHGWGRPKRAPLSHISYNDETWHSYTLLKEDPNKDKNLVTHHVSSADLSILSPKISNFCYIKK